MSVSLSVDTRSTERHNRRCRGLRRRRLVVIEEGVVERLSRDTGFGVCGGEDCRRVVDLMQFLDFEVCVGIDSMLLIDCELSRGLDCE